MVIVYILASLVGALTSVAVLWPYSWVAALVCAPVGGSLMTFAVVAVVFLGAERAGRKITDRPSQGHTAPTDADLPEPLTDP